jgi:hypothetical protein
MTVPIFSQMLTSNLADRFRAQTTYATTCSRSPGTRAQTSMAIFYVFPNNGYDFNIEVGVFGYVDRYNVGNLHPDGRQHFSTDESLAIEQLIRSYFLSNPSGTS